MPRVLQAAVAYLLVKQLTKPWEDWDIFKLGLIDDKGKTLRKAKTKEEKSAMNTGVIFAKNLKKLMQMIPFGTSLLGSIAAAIFLLKEHEGIDSSDRQFENLVLEYIHESIPESQSILVESDNEFTEQYMYLSPGRYTDTNNPKSIYLIKEKIYPIDVIYGIPLWEVYDLVTKERNIVSNYDIREME